MTGKIADWTPDRPPTPDEVEDAYRVSGFQPRPSTFFAMRGETPYGCAWGAIAAAKTGINLGEFVTMDVFGLLGVREMEGTAFMNGFDHRDAWRQSVSPHPEWRQAGVDAAFRMFEGVGVTNEQPNQ